jgi:predicted MFS family arabinose efflux permease
MIAVAQEVSEFANSLAISFGNLGISIGALGGGWVITRYGVHNTPWSMFLFCIIALVLMLFRSRAKVGEN